MNAVRALASRHTDMLTISHGSPRTGASVALPEVLCNRQRKPSEASATAFTGSSPSTKSFNCGESSGYLSRAMLTWASWCTAAVSVMGAP